MTQYFPGYPRLLMGMISVGPRVGGREVLLGIKPPLCVLYQPHPPTTFKLKQSKRQRVRAAVEAACGLALSMSPMTLIPPYPMTFNPFLIEP